MKTKKGLPMWVATLLIILLTLVALGIIYYVVWNVLNPKMIVTKEVIINNSNYPKTWKDITITRNSKISSSSDRIILSISNITPKYGCDVLVDIKEVINKSSTFEELKKNLLNNTIFDANRVRISSDNYTIYNDNNCEVNVDITDISYPSSWSENQSVDGIFFENDEDVDFRELFDGVIVQIVSRGYLLHSEDIKKKWLDVHADCIESLCPRSTNVYCGYINKADALEHCDKYKYKDYTIQLKW